LRSVPPIENNLQDKGGYKLKRQRQQTPRKGQKTNRPYGSRSKSRGPAKDPERQVDGKYMDLPMKTIEERKAAQLAKWRKELGLDEE